MATQYGWRPPYIQYAKKCIDWYGLFNEIDEAKDHGDRKVIARICERHPIKPTTLRTRYRQWTRSRRPEAQEGDIGTGCSSQRGGQNRVFSHAEAYELGQHIINVYCNQHIQITIGDISLLAMEKYQQLHPHITRGEPHHFVASRGFCERFMKQQRIVRRRGGTHRVPVTPADPAKVAKYIADCKAALTKYGAEHVLNLDETFWKLVNMIFYCYTKQGDKSPYINFHGDEKEGCTVTMIVSADGDILPTCITVEGKTDISLGKLQIDPFDDRFECFRNDNSSWNTSDIIVKIINTVIKPYLLKDTTQYHGALILDTVGIHTTDEVAEEAANSGLELIWVPEGLTGTRQPLDVGVFGPMKAFLRAEWRKKRFENLSYQPDYADAMQSLSLAINKITTHCIRKAFQDSIDHPDPIDSKIYPLPPPPPQPWEHPVIVSLPNLRSAAPLNPNPAPTSSSSSSQQESPSESKRSLSEIDKEKEDAAAALQQLYQSTPVIPSLSSNPLMHKQPPARKYGKGK